MRTLVLGAALAAGVSLGGCAYNGFGSGVSLGYGNYGAYGSPYGYSRYGYGSPYGYGSRYGYGSPYGYYKSPYGYGSGYASSWYDPFGYGGFYGSPYFGWYDGFYYPGSGIYVYDRYRRPRVWTDRHRSFWTLQRQRALRSTSNRSQTTLKQNWSGFDRPQVTRTTSATTRPMLRTQRSQRIQSDAEDRRLERRTLSRKGTVLRRSRRTSDD